MIETCRPGPYRPAGLRELRIEASADGRTLRGWMNPAVAGSGNPPIPYGEEPGPPHTSWRPRVGAASHYEDWGNGRGATLTARFTVYDPAGALGDNAARIMPGTILDHTALRGCARRPGVAGRGEREQGPP